MRSFSIFRRARHFSSGWTCRASLHYARGRATTDLTIDLPDGLPPDVHIRLRGGPGATPVRIATPAWATRVVLQPGVTSDLVIPARAEQRLLAVSITPESVFVPADAGQSDDRRSLGCWVEVVP